MRQLEHHTPGPWRILECQNDHEAFSIESEEKLIGWVANSLDRVGDEYTSASDLANARLIAASPELLAALELINVDKDGDGFVCREGMGQVRQAIAKAKGRAA